MPYIPFTDGQKQIANSVDLAELLRCRGERLLRSGPELRMESDHSITIRGNKWYDHAAQRGGGPVEFVRAYYGMSYPEAMQLLLGGYGRATPFPETKPSAPKPEREFTLPRANKDMRRVFAYLTKARGIDPKIISAFAKKKLIYEDAIHHNAVFVGRDRDGTPRHAHLRSTQSFGATFRINMEGSRPQYTFHWPGQNDTLCVFEAPIDLLSYLSLHPEGWENSSYVALCGLSEKPILWMLEQYPDLRQVALCLDNDQAGRSAIQRITGILAGKGYGEVTARFSMRKDWNEDLKTAKGLPREESAHGRKLDENMLEELAEDTSLEKGRLAQLKIPALLGQRDRYLQIGLSAKADECLKAAASYAISAAMREYHQMGNVIREEDAATYIKAVYEGIGGADRLADDLSDIQKQAQGIHTAEEKRGIAESWLTFAAQCLGAMGPTQEFQREAEQNLTMEMGGIG